MNLQRIALKVKWLVQHPFVITFTISHLPWLHLVSEINRIRGWRNRMKWPRIVCNLADTFNLSPSLKSWVLKFSSTFYFTNSYCLYLMSSTTTDTVSNSSYPDIYPNIFMFRQIFCGNLDRCTYMTVLTFRLLLADFNHQLWCLLVQY